MNPDWERKKISEIASHSLGKMLDKAKNKGQPRRYLRNLNVRWFEFDLSDLLEMRFLSEEEARYTVTKGDVVVCEGGYPGRAAIWEKDEPIHFQKALHRVRFNEPERAIWFLYYLHMKDLDGSLKTHFSGAGIQHFTGEALAKFEIPLPPLEVQRGILAILDEAFAGIATAKAKVENILRNADELFDGLRRSEFHDRDWKETPFEDCLEEVTYTSKVQRKHFLGDGKYPIISQEEAFINGYWDNPADVFRVDRPLVLFGDHTKALKYIDFDFVLGADGVKILKPRTFLHPRFFYHQLRTARLASLGYARHYKLLKELVIRYPSLSEQKRIAEKLDAMDDQAAHLQFLHTRKLAALDELKKSLMQLAFSGQLTGLHE